MSKYEIIGTGCGSGHSYTVIKDGASYGTQEAQCPDVNSYFVNYYHGNEVWVNGVKLTTASGQATDMLIQLMPRTGAWGAYLLAHTITNPTVADYLDYFNSTPPEQPELPGTPTKSNNILKALAAASALTAGAVLLKRR